MEKRHKAVVLLRPSVRQSESGRSYARSIIHWILVSYYFSNEIIDERRSRKMRKAERHAFIIEYRNPMKTCCKLCHNVQCAEFMNF